MFQSALLFSAGMPHRLALASYVVHAPLLFTVFSLKPQNIHKQKGWMYKVGPEVSPCVAFEVFCEHVPSIMTLCTKTHSFGSNRQLVLLEARWSLIFDASHQIKLNASLCPFMTIINRQRNRTILLILGSTSRYDDVELG